MKGRILLLLASVAATLASVPVAAALPATASGSSDDLFGDALRRSVTFFETHVSSGGAYHQSYDPALNGRDDHAELPVTAEVGLAYVSAFEATGDRSLLEPAKEIARLFGANQLGITGGWWHDFYVDEHSVRPGFLFLRSDEAAGTSPVDNAYSVYRDDKSLATLRFLMRLDKALGSDPGVHDTVAYALEGLLKAQYPTGAFPDFHYPCSDARSIRCKATFSSGRATIPTSWPRIWPGTQWPEWSQFSSLNDGTTTLALQTLFEAWATYGDARYKAAAVRTVDWLLRAQFPMPQPGWAQMYDENMVPRWQRSFEPPALAARETMWAIRSLLVAYRATGNTAYRDAAQRASDWLAPLGFDRFGNGVRWWPQFVEFGSNRPVFVDKSNTMTTDSNAALNNPSYYYIVEDIALVPEQVRTVDSASCSVSPDERAAWALKIGPEAQGLVDALDPSGRWLTSGQLLASVFAQNVKTLAAYVGLRDGRSTYLDSDSVWRNWTNVKDDPCRFIGGPAAVPTAVKVLRFGVEKTPAGVRVSWRTAQETRVVAFNVYRFGVGGPKRVNRLPIRAKSGTLRGASYTLVDPARVQTPLYRLEVVRRDGTRSWVAVGRAPR